MYIPENKVELPLWSLLIVSNVLVSKLCLLPIMYTSSYSLHSDSNAVHGTYQLFLKSVVMFYLFMYFLQL